MVNIQYDDDLKFIRKNLTHVNINIIKNYLEQNIFSDDTIIRENSCEIYSFLFSILTINWKEGINYIIDSFENRDFLPNGFISILLIMKKICNQINFDVEILQIFQSQVFQTFSFALNIICAETNEEKYTPELRVSACNYIIDLIKKDKIICDEKIAGFSICDILNSLSNSFQIFDEHLYNALNHLQYKIIKKFYNKSFTFIDKMLEYTEKGIDLFIDHPKCAMSSLNFLIKLGLFSKRMIKKCEYYIKLNKKNDCEIEPQLLIELVINRIIQKLFYIIENIDEDDTEVEDIVSNPKPSMYAVYVIINFHIILPSEINSIVKKQIKEKFFTKDKWTNMHTIMILIYSICGKPLDENIGKFIKSYFNLMIEASLPNQVPRLRETALYSIIESINNYPKLFESNAKQWIKEIIDSIIMPTIEIDESELENVSKDDLIIFDRYLLLIKHSSSILKSNKAEYDNNLFDRFYKIVDLIFNLGIQKKDQNIIKYSSETLNDLICNSNIIDINIHDIYKNKLNMLDEYKSLNCPDDTSFNIQACLCTNISAFLFKIRNDGIKSQTIFSEFSHQTFSILFDLLNTKNDDVLAEVFIAVARLINTICNMEFDNNLFNPENINKLITQFAFKGLNSGNIKVINSACILISNLYYFLSPSIHELNQYIPDLFKSLSDILLDHKELKDSFPFVLDSISDIFNSVNANGSSKQIPFFEPELRKLFNSICDISDELDITKQNDVNFGNLFYQYLSEAFTSYAKIYYDRYDTQIEREQLFMLDKLANKIWKLSPEISKPLMMSFAKTAQAFAEHCSRRNAVNLNRYSNHRLLKFGYENIIDQKKYFKELSDFLKSSPFKN